MPERQTLVQLAYVYTALTVALDCACAAVPCMLLRDLQMHGRVKASLLGLLAFGAVAALCALARVPHIWHYYDPEHDLMCMFLPLSIPYHIPYSLLQPLSSWDIC